MNSRRRFIKTGCAVCLGSAALGLTLPACTSLAVYHTDVSGSLLEFPMDRLSDEKLFIARASKLPFDILIVRDTENKFHALYMQCTHQYNALTATSSGLYCPVHGSAFDLNGKVKRGPAIDPLIRFSTEIKDHKLIVNLKS